jgi:choline-sulfatase
MHYADKYSIIKFFRGVFRVFFVSGLLFYALIKSPAYLHAAEPTRLSGKYKDCNVILIILDALRPDHLSCYGYAEKTSPNIDALADRGVVFTKAFSTAAYTLPGVASIFTSLYPDSHNMTEIFKDDLADNIYTLAQILNVGGYKTAWFGEINDPHSGAAKGLLNGFMVKKDISGPFSAHKYEDFKTVCAWIEKNSQQPFFLTAHAYITHEQRFPFLRFFNRFSQNLSTRFKDELDELNRQQWWESPGANNYMSIDFKARLERVSRLNYCWDEGYKAFLGHLDKERLREFMALMDSSIYQADQKLIGGVVDELKKNGIYDKTIIVITADHGDEYNEHGAFGHSSKLYDESIHVPLIYYLPGVKKGRRIDALTQSIDILPTLLELLSIPVPAQAQGISLVGVIAGSKNTAVNEFVFSRGTNGIISIRTKRWKYIQRNNYSPQGEDRISEELFDLNADPAEQRNLVSFRHAIAQKLKDRLAEWKKTRVIYNTKKSEFPAEITDQIKERIRKTGYW